MLLRRAASACLLGALAMASVGCSDQDPGGSATAPPAPATAAEPSRPRDIVLVVIDTLRADAVGAWAGEDRGTPVLDRLAREGVMFERASSTSSYTRESVLSLFTGMLPSSVGRTGWNAAPAGDSVTVPFWMRRSGRRPILVSASVMLNPPGFLRGFDAKQMVGGSQNVSQQSPEVSQTALRLAAEKPDRPVFLYVHYLDPHAPYDPVDWPDAPASVALYDQVRGDLPSLQADGFGPGEARFEDMRERYAAELRHVDAALGKLLAGLDAQGRLEDALVVVTSDHGEEFLEHGYVEHAWTLFEESIHVPLIFHAPSLLAPARVPDRVSGVDVLPSLLALVGQTGAETDGKSLFAWDGQSWQPRPRTGPIHAELGIQSRLLLRSVVVDDTKYLAARRWLSPEERSAAVREDRIGPLPAGSMPVDPWGEIVRETAFDLATDPDEQHPLDDPETVALLREYVEARRPADAEAPGPAPETPMSDDERARLEALGYL